MKESATWGWMQWSSARRPSRRAWCMRFVAWSVMTLFFFTCSDSKWTPSFYERAQDAVYDALATKYVASPQALLHESRITIIDIDESSLEIFGSWPWPRTLTARLINDLTEYEPLSIGLDIIFPDLTRPSEDQSLAKTLVHPQVVMAQAFDLSPLSEPPRAGLVANGQKTENLAQRAYGYIGNHPIFLQGRTQGCVGHITPSPSVDGVVRHIAPWIQWQDKHYPMLAIAMLECSRANHELTVNSLIPIFSPNTDKPNQWRFHWTRSIAAYNVISAKDVLAKKIDASYLRDRYILVGSSALGIGDRVSSPIAPWLPGVMVHAQILTQLLDRLDQPAQSISTGSSWALIYAASLMIVMCFCLYRKNLWWALAFAGLMSIAWWPIMQWLYMSGRSTEWLLPWAMVLVWLLVYVPTEWWINQSQHQEKVRRLGAYLAPALVPQVLSEDYEKLLAPQRRIVTILFVDVAHYTTLSETLSPESLTRLTQAILSELTSAVHASKGTLDKYMGDALMAFWGAPISDPNHADHAITCALEMLDRIAHQNSVWQRHFGLQQAIEIHIGINTGDVVVGEMGSDIRKTYTAIGDAVNIAARLQEQAKIWVHPILLGASTAQHSHQYATMSLGSITLRGKNQVQQLYSLAELGRPHGIDL